MAPPPPPPTVYDEVIVQFELNKPLVKVAGVPPEEMRLDRYARSFHDSRIVGHERVVPIDQMVAMGYDREECLDHLQSQDINEFTMEAQIRNPGRAMSTRVGDGVKYGEWYIRADQNGDGVPELRYICTMGEDRKIVHDEEANRIKFALFSPDPISHTIVGDSITDYTLDIQRIKTNMMRGVLDSLAESINPKTVVNELMVNMDDALNDDLGAVVRTRGDPSAAVMYTNTPFVGQPAMEVIALLNDMLTRRTGLSDAAQGSGSEGDPVIDADRRRGGDQRRAGAGRAGGADAVRNRLQRPVQGDFLRDLREPEPGPYAADERQVRGVRSFHVRRQHVGRGQSEPRQGQRHGADDGARRHQAGSAGIGGADGDEQPDLRIPSRC